MKKLVFTLLLFLTAGCAASPKECASIKSSISVLKMEENQKAAQGYELFSTYKKPELIQKNMESTIVSKQKTNPNVIAI